MRLGIWCPTYKRPHVLQRLVDNIEATTKGDFMLYFGCEPEDTDTIEAAKKTGYPVIINKGDMGYSDTIQTIYEHTNDPFFIHINDDFHFLPNWNPTPMSMFDREDLMVVGLRQREQDTDGSAIFMVRRKYIEEQSGVVDMPNRVFYPYHHNYIDTEFTQTAQARGVWAKCHPLLIIHKHPGFTGAEKDETYKKNDATADKDRQTFESRRHLWQDL